MNLDIMSGRVKLITVITLITVFLSPTLFANSEFTPVFKPEINITSTKGKIEIDGELTDSGWQGLKATSQFVERSPGENTKPDVETETFITFDENYLYVAFKCYDDPATIRAMMCQRDQFYGDDAVAVLIDTYGKADWAYEFYVNPYGIQKDMLWNSVQGTDIGFDMIWHSAAKITSEGYQVEIAIPFSSLRFPNNDVQSWKMDFWRNHPRENFKTYSWAANDRNESCFPCQWGTVTGIRDVEAGRGVELIGTVIGDQKSERVYLSEGSEFNNYDPDGEFSLGGKYTIGSDVTIEATINPDFSQIEADAAQVDVNSTYALYFPERRPFFQEGADIFRTMFNSIYSRTIYDPDVALKVTGRPGSFRFGLLSAVEDSSYYVLPFEERSAEVKTGQNYVNIFRASKSFAGNSRVGFMVNDRRYENDGFNTIFSPDVDINFSRRLRFDAQYIYTYTKEQEGDDKLNEDLVNNNSWVENTPTFDEGRYTFLFDGESYSGDALIARLHYRTRELYSQIQYNYISPTYRTQTGFDPVNAHRTAQANLHYTFYLDDNKHFERMSPSMFYFARWNYHTGEKKLESINMQYYTRLNYYQTNVSLNVNRDFEIFNDTEYADMMSYGINVNSQFSESFGMYASINLGERIARGPNRRADQISISTGFDFKPLDRFFIEPNFTFVKGDDQEINVEWYRQFISRTRFQFQFNKKLSLRLVAQYVYFNANDPLENGEYGVYESRRMNIDPLVTYRINPYTVFYIGSTTHFNDLLLDYNNDPNNPFMLKRDFELNRRKFFLKLQYLFQV